LEAELKRATDAETIDAPKDALLAITRASNNEDDRRTIMRHIYGCLAEQASCQWRRVFLGLVVIEELLKNGDPLLVKETAEGGHFDLVQRLTFLAKYEFGNDKRVESMVRRKADGLRSAWLEKQNEAQGLPACSSVAPAATSKSPSASATSAPSNDKAGAKSFSSNAGAKSFSSNDIGTGTLPGEFQAESGKNRNYGGLGGLVSVGHNEDTTDEESGGEGSRGRVTRQKQTNKKKEKPQPQPNLLEDLSTTDDSSCGSSPQQPERKGVNSGYSTDLLGGVGGDDLLSLGPQAASQPPSKVEPAFGGSNDLLGGLLDFEVPPAAAQSAATVPTAASFDLI